MTLRPCFFASLFLCLCLLPLTAHAETDHEPSPTASFRFNPAALAIGRVSGEGEVWLTRHLSLVGTMFHGEWREAGGSYDEEDEDYGTYENHPTHAPSSALVLTGFEVGLRYTALERLSRGVRVGAFGGVALGPAWGRWTTTTEGERSTSHGISQVTGAVEFGGLMIVGPVILETGLGLQATHDFHEDPTGYCGDAGWFCESSTHWFYGSGFTPRVLFSVGFVF